MLQILIIIKNFGVKLTYIRKAKRLSQVKSAGIADMNFNFIGLIERGDTNITIHTIKAIANVLNIDLKGLFDFIF